MCLKDCMYAICLNYLHRRTTQVNVSLGKSVIILMHLSWTATNLPKYESRKKTLILYVTFEHSKCVVKYYKKGHTNLTVVYYGNQILFCTSIFKIISSGKQQEIQCHFYAIVLHTKNLQKIFNTYILGTHS